VRQRRIGLGGDHRHGIAGFAHLEAFADAQDDPKSGQKRGFGLGLDFRIGFALRLAPFGMADDRQAGPGIGQHRRADAAGVRALVGEVQVLGADREPRDRTCGALDQGRGNAQGDVDRREALRARGDRLHLVEVGLDPVHLPVAGNQLSQPHQRSSRSAAALTSLPVQRKVGRLDAGPAAP
jgi:hypothetical protein